MTAPPYLLKNSTFLLLSAVPTLTLISRQRMSLKDTDQCFCGKVNKFDLIKYIQLLLRNVPKMIV